MRFCVSTKLTVDGLAAGSLSGKGIDHQTWLNIGAITYGILKTTNAWIPPPRDFSTISLGCSLSIRNFLGFFSDSNL